jgi:phosphoserine aminotransferase
MTVKNIIEQVEVVYGRKPHEYMKQLINDALIDIASKKQHYVVSAKTNLTSGVRWYDLPARTIDIIKVEILDTSSTTPRYNLIPKLTDPHKLLKSDTDDSGKGDVS